MNIFLRAQGLKSVAPLMGCHHSGNVYFDYGGRREAGGAYYLLKKGSLHGKNFTCTKDWIKQAS